MGSLVPMRLAALLVLVLLLTGCVPALDRDQARQCRTTLTALLDDATTIAVRDQDAARLPSGGTEVRIAYRADSADGEASQGTVTCSFGTGVDRLRLRALRLPAGPLPEARVVMLDRFWLAATDALAHDPAPLPGSGRALALPAGTGYPLQQVLNALPGAAVYGLLATAYALIYGLVGRINLAFGAFAALGGSAALLPMLAGEAWPAAVLLPVALLTALACAGVNGAVAGRLVFDRLHGASGQQGLVATVGLGLFLSEYVRLTQGSETRWAVPVLDSPLAIAADPDFSVTITPVALLIVASAGGAAAVLLAAMRRSRFGRNWRAFSDDPGAAALCGVGRSGLFTATFSLSCALAGLAGGLTVLAYGSLGTDYATTLGVKALTAAVLGGIGSVPGAFLGGLFLGLAEAGWSAAFPVVHRDLMAFSLLVACLVWRPGGFFGYRDLLPRRV